MAITQAALAVQHGVNANQLRALLRSFGIMVKAAGGFDDEFANGVKAFQLTAVDQTGHPLAVDGLIGARTLAALRNQNIPATPLAIANLVWPPLRANVSGRLGLAALQCAYGQLGAWRQTLNQQNALRLKYQKFVHIGPTDNWCAAFASWCVAQAELTVVSHLPIPKSAGARDFFDDVFEHATTKRYALRKALNPTPQCGDIIVWWRKSLLNDWRGHIGFVYDFDGVYVRTIEGNAGNVITDKTYQQPFDYPIHSDQKNPRGFYGLIRLP